MVQTQHLPYLVSHPRKRQGYMHAIEGVDRLIAVSGGLRRTYERGSRMPAARAVPRRPRRAVGRPVEDQRHAGTVVERRRRRGDRNGGASVAGRPAARTRGEVLGVDEHAYPLDAGSTMRYQPAFASLPPRHSLPAPLDVADIDRFLDTTAAAYRLTWT